MTDMPWTPHFEEVLRSHLPMAAEVSILPASELRDLGLDSMEIVGLLLDLEGAFAISFPDDLLTPATFATAGSLWTAVAALAALRSPRLNPGDAQ